MYTEYMRNESVCILGICGMNLYICIQNTESTRNEINLCKNFCCAGKDFGDSKPKS